MKRILWTFLLALAGFWFAWIGQGKRSDLVLLPIFTVWGACVGFGLGSIFDQRIGSKHLVLYWSLTSGLAVLILFPLMPFRSVLVQLAAAFAIGGLTGVFVGTAHLRLSTQKSRTANAAKAP